MWFLGINKSNIINPEIYKHSTVPVKKKKKTGGKISLTPGESLDQLEWHLYFQGHGWAEDFCRNLRKPR